MQDGYCGFNTGNFVHTPWRDPLKLRKSMKLHQGVTCAICIHMYLGCIPKDM